MNRRHAVLGLVALGAAPLAARAQLQGKVWHVGFLLLRPLSSREADVYAFPQGMSDLGYVEGRNLVMEWRSADGNYERLPSLAKQLAALKPDVIVAAGTPATGAAQKATSTIPIVMTVVTDPVGSGFVKSLARPEGNITGVSNATADIGAKQLQVLTTMVPRLSRVAVLFNPANAGQGLILNNIAAAATQRGVTTTAVEAKTVSEIESAFLRMSRERVGAVIVLADGFLILQRNQIAALAVKSRIPSVFGLREHVEAGGLMSYGPSFAELYRSAAIYVDKIFKGAKPADLPVEQPTKFELVINRRTAKALGLTIPQELVLRADEVI